MMDIVFGENGLIEVEDKKRPDAKNERKFYCHKLREKILSYVKTITKENLLPIF